MIDPLEAIIQFLLDDTALAALVAGRVATKHRYGETWTVGSTGMAVRLDGGEVEVDAPVQRPRLEVRIYGSSTVTVMNVYLRLVAMSRAADRESVTLTGEDGFVHWLLPVSGLSMLFDDDLGMDMGMVFLNGCVGELGLG